MILIDPDRIKEIDNYASDVIGINKITLMGRAGEAVARAVRSFVNPGSRVSILAGKGNNGGDGYAAAILLFEDYDVTVYDVFDAGQSTEEGRFYLDGYKNKNGRIIPLDFSDGTISELVLSDCFVDAVFGTGFKGKYPDNCIKISKLFRSLDKSIIIAVDVPLGVNSLYINLALTIILSPSILTHYTNYIILDNHYTVNNNNFLKTPKSTL